MLAVLVMSAAYGLMTSPAVAVDTSNLPSTPQVLNNSTQRTLRVEGYGDEAQTGVGGALQNPGGVQEAQQLTDPVKKPGESGGTTQQLQNNSGESSLEQ